MKPLPAILAILTLGTFVAGCHRHETDSPLSVEAPADEPPASTNRVRFTARPGSKVTVDGTSTIHDWTVKGGIIGGYFEASDSFLAGGAASRAAQASADSNRPTAQVTIPIRSLKSQTAVGASKMDEIMQEAMRAKENPVIQYTLNQIQFQGTNRPPRFPLVLDTQGELAVAGVKRTIAMPVQLDRTDDGRLRFAATHRLKMTDFNIKPPAPAWMGGVIKTGDDVVVAFEWYVGPQAATNRATTSP